MVDNDEEDGEDENTSTMGDEEDGEDENTSTMGDLDDDKDDPDYSQEEGTGSESGSDDDDTVPESEILKDTSFDTSFDNLQEVLRSVGLQEQEIKKVKEPQLDSLESALRELQQQRKAYAVIMQQLRSKRIFNDFLFNIPIRELKRQKDARDRLKSMKPRNNQIGGILVRITKPKTIEFIVASVIKKIQKKLKYYKKMSRIASRVFRNKTTFDRVEKKLTHAASAIENADRSFENERVTVLEKREKAAAAKARKAAEADAAARRAAEEQARRAAEADAAARRAAEADPEARRAAKAQADAEAKRLAEEKEKRLAEEKEKRLAEEQARKREFEARLKSYPLTSLADMKRREEERAARQLDTIAARVASVRDTMRKPDGSFPPFADFIRTTNRKFEDEFKEANRAGDAAKQAYLAASSERDKAWAEVFAFYGLENALPTVQLATFEQSRKYYFGALVREREKIRDRLRTQAQARRP